MVFGESLNGFAKKIICTVAIVGTYVQCKMMPSKTVNSDKADCTLVYCIQYYFSVTDNEYLLRQNNQTEKYPKEHCYGRLNSSGKN